MIKPEDEDEEDITLAVNTFTLKIPMILSLSFY